jgi:hypothetical protein
MERGIKMENIQKALSMEEASKVLKEIESHGAMNITEELIKDNAISFVVKEVKYRSRLLNLREKEELDTLRRKKFGQLLQDKDLMLEGKLIEVYKERGIDIAEMDEKMRKLDAEMHEKKLSLGESLAKNESENIFKAYEEQIKILIESKQILYIQKSELLQYSIESQLLNYVAELITYLSTEIEESEGKYKRLWKTLEDFKSCEDKELTDKSGIMSTLLQYAL